MNRNFFSYRLGLVVLFALVGPVRMASAQGTGFTYQGRLDQSGTPYSGSAEFQATLWSVPGGGTALASNSPLQVVVSVTNGLFVLPLDFGANFPGADRWLQLEVRTSIGAFTTLSPRQPLTPAPYAIFANTASNISGTLAAAQLSGALPSAQLLGTYSNVVTLDNAANSFNGTFSGNGGGLTNVNVTTLGGVAASNLWQLGGNNVAAGQFLGSTNNQPVDIKVRGSSALRLQPSTNDAPNIVGGAPGNFIGGNVVGSTIVGGGSTNYNGANNFTNFVGADFSVIAGGGNNRVESGSRNSFLGGGLGNVIHSGVPLSSIGGGSGNEIVAAFGATYCVIGGGSENIVGALNGTVGGGSENVIGGTPPIIFGSIFFNVGQYATIAGGAGNYVDFSSPGSSIGGGINNFVLNGEGSTIGGGRQNTNTGSFASIPGGNFNVAAANSFAAGHRAKAVNSGTFVWADLQTADFTSTAANQYLIRASGGVGINTNNPAGAALAVVGGIRAGVNGTIQSRVQFGTATVGTGTNGVNTFTITFPTAFTVAPKVFVMAKGNDNPDTFAISTRAVTAANFKVNITRIDIVAGWGQPLQVDWYAVE